MQLLVTVGLLLVLGVFLWWNGSRASTSLTAYRDGNAATGQMLLTWLPFAAVLIGLFWGTPVLAREFERGTHRLAWTQSVSPPRWTMVKLGGLGLAVTLCGLAFGGMMSAWLAAWGDARPIGSPNWFAVSGVVPAAWWLFLFAAGAAAGALLRRTLPAMAVTIAVFAVMTYLLFTHRVDYAAPQRIVEDSVSTSAPVSNDALIIDVTWLGPDGREIQSVHQLWTEPDAPCRQYDPMPCIYEHGYREVVYFHPESRYWRFQWTESAILLAAAAGLLAATVYRVRRRGIG
jgi:hypothetical protein